MFGFEYFTELHIVRIVQASDDFNFFYKAFLAILFTVCCFFWKSFDSIFGFIFNSFDHIHSGKVSSSYLFHRFELLVEADLIEVFFQIRLPIRSVFIDELIRKFVFTYVESQSIFWYHEPKVETEGQILLTNFHTTFMQLYWDVILSGWLFPGWLEKEFTCFCLELGFQKMFFHCVE